jgi:endonuclease VIII
VAEGDTILRLAQALEGALGGAELSARTPGRRRPDGLPVRAIQGSVLERVEPRGKHLLLHLSGGLALHSHLGMRGSWRLYRVGEPWGRSPARAWIALAGGGHEAVNFDGSSLRLVREVELARDPRLARLGPDLLAASFEPAAAARRLEGAGEVELGDALLDQSLVAGIGNIFKSEGCFSARLSPWAPVASLGIEELRDVLELTRGLMLEAVRSGHAENGVYRRAGRPCPRCGTAIRSRAQGDSARITYWCPRCQSHPSAG